MLNWLLPDANPAGAVYGTIAVGSLLAAESGLHETYIKTLGSILIALSLYWFAHAYAELLGRRLQTRAQFGAAGLYRAVLHNRAVLRGGALPLLALLLCWALGFGQETALTVALWTAAGSLIGFELLAGLRVQASPAELLREGCVGAAMGLGVLALRVLLH